MLQISPRRTADAIHPDMVWIPGGTFRMGSDNHYPEEAPAHSVTVDGFWMDQHPITNRQFREFVRATSHVTFAEIPPHPNDRSVQSDGMNLPGSFVFMPPKRALHMSSPEHWWKFVEDVNWRHPYSPKRTNDGLDDHPVVHIAYSDAYLYARWAGKQLPTEAEWEFAARGGLDGAEYAWGDEFMPNGRHMANTWQGEFPAKNLVEDGFYRTSPVTAFPRNGYGLRDMIGNVWEWTADWFEPKHFVDPSDPLRIFKNPCGAPMDASYDPSQPDFKMPRKVIKGGSYLSAPNYCRRYRPAARLGHAVDISADDLGFRCVLRPRTN
jgi:formylglycine-generating enzyme required for sulfatase activity